MTTPPRKTPLVTVAIPTFNRAKLLRRAASSVLAQGYTPLEVVITDNASADDTSAVAQAIAAGDPRVMYLRHPDQVSPAANFRSGLEAAKGEYFMWVADDDWIDSGYVAACVAVLEADPGCVLATGRTKYYHSEKYAFDGDPTNITGDTPTDRVLEYYRQVTDNGVFYGVMRKAAVQAVVSNPTFAGDWLFVAQLAALGRIRTVDSVVVHRDLPATSIDWRSFVRPYRLPRMLRNSPFLVTGWNAAIDILWRRRVMRRIPAAKRLRLAVAAFGLVARRNYRWSVNPNAASSTWTGRAQLAGWRFLRSLLRIES